MGLCTVFSLCIFIILLVLRTANVPHIIRNTDVVGLLEQAAIGENPLHFVDQINQLPFHNANINSHDVEDFIRSDAVSDEIGSIFEGYASAFAAGNLEHHMTADDIVYAARNLEPEFQELFDHQMTEADYEHFARTLDNMVDFSSLSVSGIMDEYDIGMTIPGMLLSSALLWIVGIVCAVFLLLIFLMRIGSMGHAFRAVGFLIAAAGLIMFVLGLFMGASPGAFGRTVQYILRFLDGLVRLVMQYGLTFAAVGAAIIAISLIFSFIAPRTNVQ